MTLQLYDLAGGDERVRFSPYCWRVQMALAHKGLDYETVPVRFGEKEKVAFSGQKLVPVLRDGAKVVSDSWDIGIYLDTAYPDRPPLMDGPQARALTNSFRLWTQTRIAPAIMRLVMLDILAVCSKADQEYFRTSREARFGKSLEEFVLPEDEGKAGLSSELQPFRDVLIEQNFACGDAPGFADYILFGMFMWARGVSSKKILQPDDPVYCWREKLLDLYGGLARNTPGLGA